MLKRKLLSCVLLAVMCFSLAACQQSADKNDANTQNEAAENNAPEKIDATDSADVLNKVLAKYDESEKFPILGGNIENAVDGGAGIFDTSDMEVTVSMLHVTDVIMEQVDETASMMHAMNANTFTAVAFKLKEGADVIAFENALKESIQGTQWICGFPERLVVFDLNSEYSVYAIGNSDLIDNFTETMQEVYGDSAVISVQDSI